jgi:hypothetical protein
MADTQWRGSEDRESAEKAGNDTLHIIHPQILLFAKEINNVVNPHRHHQHTHARPRAHTHKHA